MAKAKTNTNTNTKAKGSRVTPDFTTFIDEDNNIEISLYMNDDSISAKLTFCDCFVCYARVIKGKNGYFLSMPSYKTKDGEYKSQAFFFDKDILAAVNAFLNNCI